MVRMRRRLAFGLSLARREYKAGEPITLHLWVDNTGSKPAGVMTCSDLGYFWACGFDVYAARGHRVLRRSEAKMQEECRNNPGERQYSDDIWICGRAFPIDIPAHTCVTRDDFDFTAVLTDHFDLPPGEYTVRFRKDSDVARDPCRPEEKQTPATASGPALNFSVVQP